MDQERMALLGTGQRELLPADHFGNKAAMLSRFDSLDIRFPPAFVLGVSVCEDYFSHDRTLPKDIPQLVDEGIKFLERSTGLQFGGNWRVLMVSVRSGAPVPMPGMMTTVLDVGLGKQGVDSLIARSGNPRFGWDCYRRLISSYAEAVDHHDRRHYERVLNETLLSLHLDDSTEMDSKVVRSLAEAYERKYDNLAGRPFPQEPQVQLLEAVSAVLDSWASPQAEAYRKMASMHSVRGTAVIIQTMVFGNMGSRSGSGVAFTRNPWTGTAEMVMDFRFGVQGEDVVSGEQEADQALQLKRLLPQVDEELHAIGKRLEANLQDMQDLEFTVQEGELFLLQSRAGKRSPLAAAMIAVELAEDSVITQQEAWERLKDIDLDALVEHRIVAERPVLAKGTSASLGIVTGNIVLSSEEAIKRSAQEPVILVKHSLNPGDLPGVVTSSGVITAHGNRMAHAIVVARQLNKACIVNVDGLVVDTPHHSILLGGKRFLEGAVISMNSQTGEIFEGPVSVINDRPVGLLDRIGALRKQVLCGQSG